MLLSEGLRKSRRMYLFYSNLEHKCKRAHYYCNLYLIGGISLKILNSGL